MQVFRGFQGIRYFLKRRFCRLGCRLQLRHIRLFPPGNRALCRRALCLRRVFLLVKVADFLLQAVRLFCIIVRRQCLPLRFIQRLIRHRLLILLVKFFRIRLFLRHLLVQPPNLRFAVRFRFLRLTFFFRSLTCRRFRLLLCFLRLCALCHRVLARAVCAAGQFFLMQLPRFFCFSLFHCGGFCRLLRGGCCLFQLVALCLRPFEIFSHVVQRLHLRLNRLRRALQFRQPRRQHRFHVRRRCHRHIFADVRRVLYQLFFRFFSGFLPLCQLDLRRFRFFCFLFLRFRRVIRRLAQLLQLLTVQLLIFLRELARRGMFQRAADRAGLSGHKFTRQ